MVLYQQILLRILKKFKNSNQKLIFYNVPAEISQQIESLEGVYKNTLKLTNVTEVLHSIEEKTTEVGETSALLKDQDCDGKV